MVLIKAGVGAMLGAMLGAAAWVAIGYFTGAEVGIVAWAIGAAAGFGTALLVREQVNATTGVIAAVIAVLAILVAKYAVVYAVVERDMPSLATITSLASNVDAKAVLADEVVAEWEAAGKTLAWPAGNDSDTAEYPDQYPKDVVAETDKRWNALGPENQQTKQEELRTELKKMAETFDTSFKPDIRNKAFKESFGLYDVLWIGLAVASAVRLGSGGKK